MIEVNNFIEHNTLMTNNFLQNPLYLEKIKKMKKIKRAMAPLKEEENKKYFQTMEYIIIIIEVDMKENLKMVYSMIMVFFINKIKKYIQNLKIINL